uniref:Uncharacterized protein n=1 Tax=Arundo donax TaxID=35708 RepID=A0A0A9HJM7_ARUDO
MDTVSKLQCVIELNAVKTYETTKMKLRIVGSGFNHQLTGICSCGTLGNKKMKLSIEIGLTTISNCKKTEGKSCPQSCIYSLGTEFNTPTILDVPQLPDPQAI